MPSLAPIGVTPTPALCTRLVTLGCETRAQRAVRLAGEAAATPASATQPSFELEQPNAWDNVEDIVRRAVRTPGGLWEAARYMASKGVAGWLLLVLPVLGTLAVVAYRAQTPDFNPGILLLPNVVAVLVFLTVGISFAMQFLMVGLLLVVEYALIWLALIKLIEFAVSVPIHAADAIRERYAASGTPGQAL
jgi:hypothetical protein